MSIKSTIGDGSSASFKGKQNQVKLQRAAYAEEVEKKAQTKKLKLKRELALKESWKNS